MRRKTTWREKLADDKGLPQVTTVDGKRQPQWNGVMVIPSPRQVDEIMKQVPAGKLTTINDIRTVLAKKHDADFACPMTTGIFAWIAAHAAEESREAGEAPITPYWRTLKNGGELNPKYPGGLEAIRQKLEAEGHRVVERGKRSFVADYERSLAPLKQG
jgi:hypothetical protein